MLTGGDETAAVAATAAESTPPRGAGRGRSAAVVSAATLVSRVLGLVREQVFAVLFGAGYATDAFNVAFRIPNLLRDLFAEGAMSSAFVPTFTEEMTHRGRPSAFELASAVLTALVAVTGLLTLLGVFFADPLVRLMAPGFGAVPGKLELTVLLTRIMMPFLVLIAAAAAVMGVLNSLSRFTVPALAPAMLNVGMILAGLAFVPVARRLGQPPIVAMAVGAVLGALGQLGVQLPSLVRAGWRPRLRWAPRDRGVLRVAVLMVPATIGLAATQVNIFVSTLVASLLPQGSVSWLNYAFRLMYVPIGVFGVAVATVTLPAVSRAVAVRDIDGMKRELAVSLRLVAFLTLPATAGLAALAVPLVRLLYQHGRFTAFDTQQTAGALVFYCIGLAAYSAVKVVVPTFYALRDTRTPVAASGAAVALNIALNLALMHVLAHRGLALATSATALLNLTLLLVFLRRRVGPLGLGGVARSTLRVALLSLAVGATAWIVEAALERALGTATIPARIGALAGATTSGLVVLVGLGRLLRIEEVDRAGALVARVLRRRGG